MTIVEGIVVYLSIGAPFGVLQSFSKQGQGLIAVAARSLAVMVLWPYFAFSWYLGGKKWQEKGKISKNPDMTALFEIAGHSNPALAKLCYDRSRRRISEFDRGTPAFSNPSEGSPTSEPSHTAAATL